MHTGPLRLSFRPAPRNAVSVCQRIKVLSQGCPITFSTWREVVPFHEAIYASRSPQHVLNVGCSAALLVVVVLQAFSCLFKALHEIIDVVFLFGVVESAVIKRGLKTAAKGCCLFINTTEQVLHLFFREPIRRLCGDAPRQPD